MRRRLLSKKNSSWSTFEEINDANPGDKEITLDNLALESALKAEQQRRKAYCEDQLLDKLFKTELRKLPQVTTSKTWGASSQKKQLEPCRYKSIKDEFAPKQPKDLRTYSLPTTEASWHTSTTLLSQESQMHPYHNNRARLHQLCQLQQQSFQSTYKSSTFHPSEIQSGIISNETDLKAKLTANEYVALQWQPIRNYEFGKLTRKDILPLKHEYTPAKAKGLERRMTKTIKRHLHRKCQISYLYPGKTQ